MQIRTFLLAAALALPCCSGPQLEGPPDEPTPLFELASGGQPQAPDGGVQGEADNEPRETLGDTRSSCPASDNVETLELNVGQSRTARTGLRVMFEGEVRAGDDMLASLSFSQGENEESWIPPPGGSQNFVQILGHCARAVEHNEGRVRIQLYRRAQ